jgi:hypothetical protein
VKNVSLNENKLASKVQMIANIGGFFFLYQQKPLKKLCNFGGKEKSFSLLVKISLI